MSKNDLNKLKDEIKSLQKHTNIALNLIKALEESERKSFESIPGKIGTFDGEFMVTDSGEKYPVPANYASKSLLLFGDKLKMIEEGGKPFFKNISKSPSKEIKGILSKKENDWYLLADCGSYKVSDTAASFCNARQNAEAVGLVPLDNIKAPYAALKRVVEEGGDSDKKPEKSVSIKTPQPNPKKEQKNTVKKPHATKSESSPKVEKKVEDKPKDEAKKKDLPKTEVPAPLVLEDDDLI